MATNVDRLVTYLSANGGRARLDAVLLHFPRWTGNQVLEMVRLNPTRLKRANLGKAAGIAQVASEVGARGGVPLYRDVHRVLETTWARQRKLRAATTVDSSLNGKARTGKWSRPDAVLVSFPARRSSPDQLPTLSTFEIEAPGRFDIESVAEAYAHGFGADYSWVAFYLDPKTPAVESVDWARIDALAKRCGVGLLSYSNPGDHATWNVEREPERRHEGDRTKFVDRAMPASTRHLAGLTLPGLEAAPRRS